MITHRDALGRQIPKSVLSRISCNGSSCSSKDYLKSIVVLPNGEARFREDIVIIDRKPVERHLTTFAKKDNSARTPGIRMLMTDPRLCKCGRIKVDKCPCSDHDKKNMKVHIYHCPCAHCRSVRGVEDHKRSLLLLGVELELNSVDRPENWFTNVSAIEFDCSLSWYGGEIITAPMLFEEQRLFWEASSEHLKKCDAETPNLKLIKDPRLKDVVKQGCYTGDNHGMHVHVNRVVLSSREWVSLIKAVQMGLKDILTKIGGRPSGRFREFLSECQIHYVDTWVEENQKSHNLCFTVNMNTVEFRFPKSSTLLPVIMGRIGMVESVVQMFIDTPSLDENTTEKQYLDYLNKPESKKRWSETLWLATQPKPL